MLCFTHHEDLFQFLFQEAKNGALKGLHLALGKQGTRLWISALWGSVGLCSKAFRADGMRGFCFTVMQGDRTWEILSVWRDDPFAEGVGALGEVHRVEVPAVEAV